MSLDLAYRGLGFLILTAQGVSVGLYRAVGGMEVRYGGWGDTRHWLRFWG